MCGALVHGSRVVCEACAATQRDVATLILQGRAARAETQAALLQTLCVQCGGGDGSGRGHVVCASLDCPALYERRKRALELSAAEHRLRAALTW